MLYIPRIWSMCLDSDVSSTVAAVLTLHRVHKMREELCDETLAYDLEF
jgi:hypothetical protein